MPNDVRAKAKDAIHEVVFAAWHLLDNTGHNSDGTVDVEPFFWKELEKAMELLGSLIPEDELPADPPDAIALFWPEDQHHAE